MPCGFGNIPHLNPWAEEDFWKILILNFFLVYKHTILFTSIKHPKDRQKTLIPWVSKHVWLPTHLSLYIQTAEGP